MTHHNTTNARLAYKSRRATICAVAAQMAIAMKKRKAAKILKDRVKVYQS